MLNQALFGKEYVSSVGVTFGFMPYGDIEKYAYPFAEKLKGFFNEKPILITANNNNPQQLRFILKSPLGNLEVSPTQARYLYNDIDNKDSVADWNSIFKSIISAFVDVQAFSFESIDFNIMHCFPLLNKDKCTTEDIINEFFKFPYSDEVSGVSFNLIYKKENYKIYSQLSEYEIKTQQFNIDDESDYVKKVQMGDKFLIKIELDKIPAQEKGIQIANKLSKKFTYIKSIVDVYEKIKDYEQDHFKNCILPILFGVKK